jgi:hypothetical protein
LASLGSLAAAALLAQAAPAAAAAAATARGGRTGPSRSSSASRATRGAPTSASGSTRSSGSRTARCAFEVKDGGRRNPVGDEKAGLADSSETHKAGLDHEDQHRAVTAAFPAMLGRRVDQRLGLLGGEEGYGASLVAFGGDAEHPADHGRVLGVTDCRVAPSASASRSAANSPLQRAGAMQRANGQQPEHWSGWLPTMGLSVRVSGRSRM